MGILGLLRQIEDLANNEYYKKYKGYKENGFYNNTPKKVANNDSNFYEDYDQMYNESYVNYDEASNEIQEVNECKRNVDILEKRSDENLGVIESIAQEITPAKLKQAIIYSEIISKPVCKRRRDNRRNGI